MKYTRGELIARSIQAHPEITEAEITNMIDAHIKAVRAATIQEALAAIRDMRGGLLHVDTLVEVSQRIEALKQRGDE